MSIRPELDLIERLLPDITDDASRQAAINIAFSAISQTFDVLEDIASSLRTIVSELEQKRGN